MATNVPSIIFTPQGPILPTEQAILAGELLDIDQAFGGGTNPALETPQGQIASSNTAIIGDVHSFIAMLCNQVDPNYASDQFQDAIGNIYFLDRIASASTVVVCDCVGVVGKTIYTGSKATDTSGNVYVSTADATIPDGGTVSIEFQNIISGPIPCPAGTLTSIYQLVDGWDTVNNPSDGVLGRDVESRTDFEFRRQNSVAGNAQGSNAAVLGAVFAVPGVLDAYVIDNSKSVASGAAITSGTISGTTLTVTTLTSGTVEVGHMVNGTGVVSGTYITAVGSGTGGTGTYAINISQSIGPIAMTTALGGVPLAANSLYVAAYGGAAQAIAEAIFTKKSPGCNYNGGVTMTVLDMTPPYSYPYPSYHVSYVVPTPTPILFSVSMQNNTSVPSNAIALIKAAIINAFSGGDGGQRARIGSVVFANRYYAPVAMLGPWASIYNIKLGITAATLDSVLFRIDQVPSIDAANIAVAFT